MAWAGHQHGLPLADRLVERVPLIYGIPASQPVSSFPWLLLYILKAVSPARLLQREETLSVPHSVPQNPLIKLNPIPSPSLVSDSSAESLHLLAWVFRKRRAITALRLLTRSSLDDGNGRAGAKRKKILACFSLAGRRCGRLLLSGSFGPLGLAHLAQSAAGSCRSLAGPDRCRLVTGCAQVQGRSNHTGLSRWQGIDPPIVQRGCAPIKHFLPF